MRDHELRSLLNLVDEPTQPPTEYVDSLWAELEETLAGNDADKREPARRFRHGWVYLSVAAALVLILGVVAVLVVDDTGASKTPQASPIPPTQPSTTSAEAESENPACDLFVANGDLGVVWRTGVVSTAGSGEYLVESDASPAQLSGSAEAVGEMAARVASGDNGAAHVAGQLERVSVDLGRASLLVRFDERVLAQEAIERARAALVGLAFEPALDECINTAAWSG